MDKLIFERDRDHNLWCSDWFFWFGKSSRLPFPPGFSSWTVLTSSGCLADFLPLLAWPFPWLLYSISSVSPFFRLMGSFSLCGMNAFGIRLKSFFSIRQLAHQQTLPFSDLGKPHFISSAFFSWWTAHWFSCSCTSAGWSFPYCLRSKNCK